MAKKQKSSPIFREFVECDATRCPARVRGYYKLIPDRQTAPIQDHDLVLGFCQHHFFIFEEKLLADGWEVMEMDGILVKDVSGRR